MFHILSKLKSTNYARNLQINDDANETNSSTGIFQESKDIIDKDNLELIRALLWYV